MKFLRRTLLFGITTIYFAVMSWAQVATGSLSGVVTDANGAAVPGASISAKNDATGVDLRTQTSEGGLYVFAAVPPGVYSVTVEKTGFKKLIRTAVEIRIATRQEMDLGLEVGDVQQSIDVTGELQSLETTSAQRGQNVSSLMMSSLPLFSGGIRNPQAFVKFMPGVNAGAAGEVTVAGAGARAQEVLIDGASLTIPESGGTVFNMPAAEMFGEFKLLTATYDAEYGRFGGGIQQFVTKSGTNDIHGTAFLNLRRDIWNASNWANNARGAPKSKDRFTEYGFAGGGPVVIPKLYDGRNKTFWYATYSKDKRPIAITNANLVSTVPTALMKQGIFTELPASQIIYDPATTSGNTRTPFANQTIPQNRFSTISQNLLSAIPDPTRAGTSNNFDFINTQVFDRYIWNIKVDHAFTPGNRLAFLVTKETQETNDLQVFNGPLGQGLQQFQRPDNWRVNHDLVIKPTVLLHSTFGYTRQRQIWDNPFQKGAASRFGFPGITGDSDAMPRICFGGTLAGGCNVGTDLFTPWGVQDGKVANGSQINITYHFSQGLSWIKGKHEFKMGWEMRRLQTTSDPVDQAGTNGRYMFLRNQTAMPGAITTTGSPFASMLLGLPNEAERVATPVLVGNLRYGYHAAYFQDNWKITSRFTASLGFRYDVPIGWHEVNGDYSGMNPLLPNKAAGNIPGALEFYGTGAGRTGDKRPYPTDFSNFGPRAGFAYRLTSKTVLRGGFGIYYQTLGNGGCGCRTGFANPIQTISDGLNSALQWDGGIAAPPGFRPPPLIDPTVGNNISVNMFTDNYGKAPRIYNWSFNLQHEIGKFLIDLAYVANRGHGLNSTIRSNQVQVGNLALGSLLSRPIDDPAVVAAGFSRPWAGFNGSLSQALRPFPQYQDVANYNSGIGRSWYDSFQGKVERRFGDWQMMGSYTFSKTLGIGHFRQIFSQGAASGYDVSAQDNYNYNEMKSYMPFDQPYVVSILNTYALPFGKGKKFMNTDNFLANLAVGNWTISATQQYRSGNLLLAQTPGNPLGTGVLFTNFTKANRNMGTDIQTGVDRTTLDPNDPSARYFNAGAFSLPGQYTLGNAAQYYSPFRNPPVFEENVSVQKQIKIPVNDTRTLDLVLRADGFNIFNRTNFGGINSIIGNANFGRVTGPQNSPRMITMGMRLYF